MTETLRATGEFEKYTFFMIEKTRHYEKRINTISLLSYIL